MENEFNISLHWGKERLNLQVENADDIITVKAKIYSLTNVLPEKQRLFFKGTLLRHGTVEKNGITADSHLMLMGKSESEGVPLAQQLANNKIIFQEDLTENDRSRLRLESTAAPSPVGLVNLGNTCYINSVVQLLYHIPEFRQAILDNSSQYGEQIDAFLLALKTLFKKLLGAEESFRPTYFLQTFFEAYPQFAEREADSVAFRQQDAEEALSLILTAVSEHIIPLEKLFYFPLEVATRNQEEKTEVEETTIKDCKLRCIIDNQMNPISQLMDGLRLGLYDSINKKSSALGRDCSFLKASRINKLPDYLIVHQMRFVWLEGDSYSNTEGRKVKILRAVNFPVTLDVFEFCSENLQAQISCARATEIEFQKSLAQQFENKLKELKNQEAEGLANLRDFKERKRSREAAIRNKRVWRKLENKGDTGHYELVGVITHQGRSGDQGHYIAWLRMIAGNWYKFDDDCVTSVSIEEILNLKGGGDWHTAYLLLYRKVQFLDEDTL